MLNTTNSDTAAVSEPKKKRILWLDIAKAIAIFAMIEGHTAPYGGALRNFIYSFHMPLFFIATGFTARAVTTWQDFFKALKKDFTRIFLPAVGIQALNGLLSFLIYHENALESIHLRVEQMFWASAFDIYGHSCVGMIWFLVALFWSKTLFNLISVLFPSKYNGAVFLCLALIGKSMSMTETYLPQSLDVCLVAALFLYLGFAFRKIYPLFEKYQIPITLAAFLIWIFCWEAGVRIDLGGRWYSDFAAGILTSVCGSLCIFTFSKALESCAPVTNVLAAMGRHTLTILCVSFLDWIALSLWCTHGYTFAYLARPAIVLFVSFIVVTVLNLLKTLKKRGAKM